MIFCQTSRARSFPTTALVLGWNRSYSASASTAVMKASVMATEMLKLVILVVSSLHAMNSRMSGWSTRRMPMLAPRRVPPCLTTSVEASYSVMKETGPEATPMVERTTSFLGRSRREAEAGAAARLVHQRHGAEGVVDAVLAVGEVSSTGNTKQAESWPRGRPAFMRVGQFGMNSRWAMEP